jgi:acetolactate synthase regulatory subunit
MRFSLRMNLSRSPGSLVRLLGIVERRGYQAVQLRVQPAPQTKNSHVEMQVQSDRSSEQLLRLLENMYDVDRPELLAESHLT